MRASKSNPERDHIFRVIEKCLHRNLQIPDCHMAVERKSPQSVRVIARSVMEPKRPRSFTVRVTEDRL